MFQIAIWRHMLAQIPRLRVGGKKVLGCEMAGRIFAADLLSVLNNWQAQVHSCGLGEEGRWNVLLIDPLGKPRAFVSGTRDSRCISGKIYREDGRVRRFSTCLGPQHAASFVILELAIGGLAFVNQ